MHLKERNKLLVLLAIHLLWGLILWFSISKYGLGVSTDAVHLLFGGLNLASGSGLTSYDGTFLILWPPLYPMLLAFVRWITGMEMLAVAALLQGLAYLGLSFCLAIFLLRIFPDDFGLAVLGTLLAQTGSVAVIGFGMVGPDYLHLLLVMLLLVLIGRYVESGSGATFVALAAVCLLVTMQRYLGVAAVTTAAVATLLLCRQSLRRRLLNSLVLCATSAPMTLWLAITARLYTRRDPISLAENFAWFSRSILEWFVGPRPGKQGLELQITLLWVVVASLAASVLVLAFRPSALSAHRTVEGGSSQPKALHYTLSLFLYGACYGMALFGSASVAYFNKLGGRFLLPLYVPLILMPVVAASILLRRARRARSSSFRRFTAAGCYILLAGLAVALLRSTVPVVIASHSNGIADGENAFNNLTWRENPAIEYWLDHKPRDEYALFSNEPDGAAFYSQHATRPAPRKKSGPYATEAIPLSRYESSLFGEGKDAYLLWILPSAYDYYYNPEELGALAYVEPLYASDEGGVYQLRPKTEQ